MGGSVRGDQWFLNDSFTGCAVVFFVEDMEGVAQVEMSFQPARACSGLRGKWAGKERTGEILVINIDERPEGQLSVEGFVGRGVGGLKWLLLVGRRGYTLDRFHVDVVWWGNGW